MVKSRVAMPAFFFFCRICAHDNWSHLYLSIFRVGYTVILLALPPNFSINPLFGKADMSSLVHSRQCGKATAVSVTFFHPDLVAEI